MLEGYLKSDLCIYKYSAVHYVNEHDQVCTASIIYSMTLTVDGWIDRSIHFQVFVNSFHFFKQILDESPTVAERTRKIHQLVSYNRPPIPPPSLSLEANSLKPFLLDSK